MLGCARAWRRVPRSGRQLDAASPVQATEQRKNSWAADEKRPHVAGALYVAQSGIGSTAQVDGDAARLNASICHMLLRSILTHAIGVLAILIAVITTNVEQLFSSEWNTLIICLAFGLAAFLAVYDIIRVVKERPKRFTGSKRETKILAYMTKLFSGDGRCVVSSNDLSWVKGDAREALLRKAESRSLELVMPASTALSQELVARGAVAHYYGDAEFRFSSRFTIVNSSRADAWVAVGMGTQDAHIIREVNANSDPTFHMATDLVKLAKRASQS